MKKDLLSREHKLYPPKRRLREFFRGIEKESRGISDAEISFTQAISYTIAQEVYGKDWDGQEPVDIDIFLKYAEENAQIVDRRDLMDAYADLGETGPDRHCRAFDLADEGTFLTTQYLLDHLQNFVTLKQLAELKDVMIQDEPEAANVFDKNYPHYAVGYLSGFGLKIETARDVVSQA